MRTLLISLFLLLIFLEVLSQVPANFDVDFDTYRPKDSLKNDSLPNLMKKNLMKKTLNIEFSNLITGQTQNSIGNFASVDITDAKVSFAGSILSDNGSVFTTKASGGISDGLLSIFGNSSLNTNISLDFQYNFLGLAKQSLLTDFSAEKKYNQAIDKIKYDYNVARWTIKIEHDKKELVKRSVAIDKEITALVEKIGSTASQVLKDSLDYELGLRKILSDSLHQAVSKFPPKLTAYHILHDNTVDLLNSLTFEPVIEGFSFGWWAIGYKVTNNSFKYIDPALAFDKQIAEKSSVNQEIRLQYSYYKLRPVSYKSFYWNIGLTYTNGDNFSTLTKTSITEEREFATTPGSRKGASTYNAYSGTYNQRLSGITGYTNLYYFLFNKNIGAIHVYPSWITQEREKPVANCSVGYLMAFRNDKTDTPVVNAELYYNFLDVFKTTDLDHRLFERNSVGIKFTFPIKFKYKLN